MPTNINFSKKLGTKKGTDISFNIPRDLVLKFNYRAKQDGGIIEAEQCLYNQLQALYLTRWVVY